MTENTTEEFLFEELNLLSQKLDKALGLPGELRDRSQNMLKRLNRMAKTGGYASEFDTLSRYIDTVVSIPWDVKTADRLDLALAKEVLDKNHYGMDGIKEIMLEFLASMVLMEKRGQNAIAKAPILLLVGLQGVGKTTLAYSVAEALNRKFMRIAMGAIGSVLEIRGKSKAFPEAEPGQIIKSLIRTGVSNPVILLDEIDKASGQEGLRNDIMAVLLEILDPKQNTDFRDHYIDYPIDLSQVLFICSANNLGTISAALLDRMEVIKMPSYTDLEKTVIARDYLLPKVLERSGLEPGEFAVDPGLWPAVVRPFGFDTGIRSLERTLQAMCRKVAKEIVEGKVTSVTITADNLKAYLPK